MRSSNTATNTPSKMPNDMSAARAARITKAKKKEAKTNAAKARMNHARAVRMAGRAKASATPTKGKNKKEEAK